jgi:hypothetical protein
MSCFYSSAWGYFISAALANVMLLISLADCRKVFFTFLCSYSIFKANRLTLITVTLPMADYYFIGHFKGSDKCYKHSEWQFTRWAWSFCTKSPYFIYYRVFWFALRSARVHPWDQHRLSLDVLQRSSAFPMSAMSRPCTKILHVHGWLVLSGLDK